MPKSNSYAGSIAQASEREQPSRETGQTEQAEGAGKEDLSRTCTRNTLSELELSLNEGEDIVSAPFNPEKLTIREKKKTRLVERQKSSPFLKRQRIKTLLFIAVPSFFCLFALVFYFTLGISSNYNLILFINLGLPTKLSPYRKQKKSEMSSTFVAAGIQFFREGCPTEE